MSNDTEPPVYYYALLDCAAHDDAYADLLSRFPESEWYSLFEGTRESELISAAPILVRIQPRGEDTRLREWLHVLERRVPSVSWIESHFGLATLGSMLTGRMPCRIDDDKEAVLRFWDPRILLGLATALDVEQRRHFFFPVNAWTAWEPRRERYYTVSPPAGAAPVMPFVVTPIFFSGAQREQLRFYDKEYLYDAIVEHWAMNCSDRVADIDVTIQREIAITAVARCTSYGILAPSAHITFAGLMMAVSPSFDDHPAVREVLENRFIPQNERLDHLIDTLPPRIWDEVATHKRYDALFEHNHPTWVDRA